MYWFCASTIFVSDSEPVIITTATLDMQQRHFVADHLRHSAHGAQQRILVAARPAGHKHRTSVDAPIAKKNSSPASMSTSTMLRPMGSTAKPINTATTRTTGARKCTAASALERNHIFLGQRFDSVGNRLQESRTDQRGSGPSDSEYAPSPLRSSKTA